MEAKPFALQAEHINTVFICLLKFWSRVEQNSVGGIGVGVGDASLLANLVWSDILFCTHWLFLCVILKVSGTWRGQLRQYRMRYEMNMSRKFSSNNLNVATCSQCLISKR